MPYCTFSTRASGTRCSTIATLLTTQEPFQKLFNQGMILAPSYRDQNGKYHLPADLEKRDGELFPPGDDRPGDRTGRQDGQVEAERRRPP